MKLSRNRSHDAHGNTYFQRADELSRALVAGDCLRGFATVLCAFAPTFKRVRHTALPPPPSGDHGAGDVARDAVVQASVALFLLLTCLARRLAQRSDPGGSM